MNKHTTNCTADQPCSLLYVSKYKHLTMHMNPNSRYVELWNVNESRNFSLILV